MDLHVPETDQLTESRMHIKDCDPWIYLLRLCKSMIVKSFRFQIPNTFNLDKLLSQIAMCFVLN
jgi:hypothetical protein